MLGSWLPSAEISKGAWLMFWELEIQRVFENPLSFWFRPVSPIYRRTKFKPLLRVWNAWLTFCCHFCACLCISAETHHKMWCSHSIFSCDPKWRSRKSNEKALKSTAQLCRFKRFCSFVWISDKPCEDAAALRSMFVSMPVTGLFSTTKRNLLTELQAGNFLLQLTTTEWRWGSGRGELPLTK